MIRDVVMLGAGYSARAFAAMRPDPGIAIAGTTRSNEKLDLLEQAGIEPLLFPGGASPGLPGRLARAEAVIVSIPPGDAGDPALGLLRGALGDGMERLRWIGYLSTVGVYGDHQGGWVDEATPCRPVARRSVLRLKAEAEWLELGRARGVAVAVLRLSGIYGPGRNPFVNLADGTARRVVKPGQVFNRIHVADIAGSLWHLAALGRGGIWNVSDDMPSPPQDVVAFAARLAGIEPPPEIPIEQAELSPLARSFYSENRRVSNAALKASGYGFRFPDYRSALAAMWADGSWAGAGRPDRRSPIATQAAAGNVAAGDRQARETPA